MKIYGVSTTRNGVITNENYTNIAAAGTDNEVPYHYWYPVKIPTGTNSLFKGLTTAEIDAVVTPYDPALTDNSASLVQERMILIHNNENKTQNQVKVFISDQQLTGTVAEITPWTLAGIEEIKPYSSFEVLSTALGNLSASNIYIKANFQTNQTVTPELSKEIVIHNMPPYGWYVAALRLYAVKDQSVAEDYCVIATETT